MADALMSMIQQDPQLSSLYQDSAVKRAWAAATPGFPDSLGALMQNSNPKVQAFAQALVGKIQQMQGGGGGGGGGMGGGGMGGGGMGGGGGMFNIFTLLFNTLCKQPCVMLHSYYFVLTFFVFVFVGMGRGGPSFGAVSSDDDDDDSDASMPELDGDEDDDDDDMPGLDGGDDDDDDDGMPGKF